MKIKVPAVFNLGTCWLVNRGNIYCATETDNNFGIANINGFTMR